MRNWPQLPHPQGLYDPRNEHDSCGVGFLVDLKGRPRHEIVSVGYGALCNLQHRGALGAEANTGDGAGLLIQVPDDFYRQVCDFDLPPVGQYATGIGFLPDATEAATPRQRGNGRHSLRGRADLAGMAGGPHLPRKPWRRRPGHHAVFLAALLPGATDSMPTP